MQILDVKKKAPKVDLGGSWASFGEGLGKVLGGVRRLWSALGSFFGVVFSCLHLGWSSKGVLEASGLDFGSILGGLEGILGGLGRVLAEILKDSGWFWATLGFSGFLGRSWTILGAFRKIFASAPCCLLLLSWRLSSKSVLSFACYCLLGHAFAPWSVELIWT